ncbi:hypothetical protein PQX77_004431 [Marasmius sp. AFHP31]|nr:hypothetical protein PQX77_004431 [Marasmius sp. AFHP31]
MTIQPPVSRVAGSPEELFVLLRSGTYVPSQETSQRIETARHQIQDYEKSVQELRTKQASLERDMVHYRSLSSPIRRFSTEILRIIFAFACGENQLGGYFGWSSDAFSLASVCNRWRDIAVNSPDLWAEMAVDIGERAIPPMQLCLARSGSHPLSIQVSGGIIELEEKPALVQNFCRILAEHSDRWRQLDLSEAEDTLIPYMANRLEQAPMLEAVICSEWGSRLLGSACFDKAPNIRTVDFHFMDGAGPMDMLELLPWASLHHLTMEHDKQELSHGLFEGLRCARDLKSLKYTGEALLDGESYKATDAALSEENRFTSNIEYLTIDMSRTRGFYDLLYDLFSPLILPSLTSLEITCEGPATIHSRPPWFRGSWPSGILRQCLQRSSCNLTVLTLQGMPLPEIDVVSVLLLAPSLQRFTLAEFGSETLYDELPRNLPQTITKWLLMRLRGIPTNNQNTICPQLTYLELRALSHFDADKEFVALLQSRQVPNGGVKRLRTDVLKVSGRELSPELYEGIGKGTIVTLFDKAGRVDESKQTSGVWLLSLDSNQRLIP